jgi:hypothetical protein
MVEAARCLDAVLAAVRLAAAVGRQLLLSNIVPEQVNNQLSITSKGKGVGMLGTSSQQKNGWQGW